LQKSSFFPQQRRQKILMVLRRATTPEGLDGVMAELAACWESPRGTIDEHNSKFSLSKKPRLNRPEEERQHF
jgi:hypothetical protein